MNINNSRFRINALIQMARITTDQEKREIYIELAEKELDNLISYETRKKRINDIDGWIKELEGNRNEQTRNKTGNSKIGK